MLTFKDRKTNNKVSLAIQAQGQEMDKSAVDQSECIGTILVIEDEKMVMTICRTILAKLGYNVLEAETGARAISIAKSYPHTIDLALLDISLPDMSGNSLYPVLMDARPNLRVLVCSGHSIDGPGEELISAGAEGFLQKPFSIAMLSEKLRQVFGAK